MSETLIMVVPLLEPTMQLLESQYNVYRLWEADDRDTLIQQVGSKVRAVVTDGHAGADAQLMRQLPNLRVVSVFGVGVDAVDLAYCSEQGIRVGNTPDVLTEDVADMALVLALGCYRQLPQADQYVRQGRWKSDGNRQLVTRFTGARVGIFGMGRIGCSIARRLEAFDCKISYCNRKRRDDVDYQYFASVAELAEQVDCLIVSVAPVPSMQGVIDSVVLAALGANGYLINVSRGFVVNEIDLAAALASRQIAGAGLDVFGEEPHVPDALVDSPYTVLQPHAASATLQTRLAMGELVIENLNCYFRGEQLEAYVA